MCIRDSVARAREGAVAAEVIARRGVRMRDDDWRYKSVRARTTRAGRRGSRSRRSRDLKHNNNAREGNLARGITTGEKI